MQKKILGGFLLGAGAAYLLAPRTRVRLGRAIGEARERLEHGHAVPDDVLEKRIRLALDHSGVDPRDVALSISEGRVRIAGEVTEVERDRVLQAIERVRGVDAINDELDVRVRARVVRARKRVVDDGEDRWSPTVRLAAGLAGGAAALQGMRRRGPVGSALGMIGASMLRRALSGRR